MSTAARKKRLSAHHHDDHERHAPSVPDQQPGTPPKYVALVEGSK